MARAQTVLRQPLGAVIKYLLFLDRSNISLHPEHYIFADVCGRFVMYPSEEHGVLKPESFRGEQQ